MEKNINKQMCKECGGLCCKQTGCVYLPKDFESMNFKFLRSQIMKGNISISGHPAPGLRLNSWTFILYLRARNENAKIVDLVNRGGKCKMLGKNGCKYKDKDRPSVGLALKPHPTIRPCTMDNYGNIVTEQWLKHQDVLHKLVKEFTGEDADEVLIRDLKCMQDELNHKIGNDETLSGMYGQWFKWIRDIIVDKPYYNSLEINDMRKKGMVYYAK